MKIEIKKIIDLDEENLTTITNWMYSWWGISDGLSFEAVKCFMKHSMQEKRLPQTYGLFLENKLIGMYQLAYEDLVVRPDIYPWLINVYIDDAYRNKGYGRILIESVKKNARENLPFDEIYLYTKHKGLYEKFGWQFVSEVDTFKEDFRIQGLYKLDLKEDSV